MNPTQKENREELLTLAVDLLGDVIALDCVLDRLGPDSPWDGIVADTLLEKLGCFLVQGAQDIALLAGLLTRRDQECAHSFRVRA